LLKGKKLTKVTTVLTVSTCFDEFNTYDGN
jgi:hypothetical protein